MSDLYHLDCRTEAGRYEPGQAISIIFRVVPPNNLSLGEDIVVSLDVFEGPRMAKSWSLRLGDLQGTRDGKYVLEIPSEGLNPEHGFAASIRLTEDNAEIARGGVAFDFSGGGDLVRYGFVSDFETAEYGRVGEVADFLSRYHLTHVLFYDWSYRPHCYRSKDPVYRDLMGKEIDGTYVKTLIETLRERGCFSMAYGAVYAAGEEYLRLHEDWAVRDYLGKAHALIEKFFIMDLGADSPWRKTVLDQYRYAVESMGFDGIHMDTYGYPKRGFVGPSGARVLRDLEQDFADLIRLCREELKPIRQGSGNTPSSLQLTFNNVGNWPPDTTGPAPQDAVYVEVWEPHVAYWQLAQIVRSAQVHGKPVVLAAYLGPFRTDPDRRRAMNSAFLFLSVCAALGSNYILFGQAGCILTQPYYSDYTKLTETELNELQPYLDFPVRYKQMYFDRDLTDITETHTAGENKEYFFSGVDTSVDARPGTVWTVVKEKLGRIVISLIDLTNQKDNLWNSGKEHEPNGGRMKIEIPLYGEPKSCIRFSVDNAWNEPVQVAWKQVPGSRGAAIEAEVLLSGFLTTLVFDYSV